MDFTRGTQTFPLCLEVTEYLRKHASQHRDFSCFTSFRQEVTSYTWIIIACGHQLVRIVLSTVKRRGEKHFMLGYLKSEGHGLQLGLYAVVEGFGVGD